VRRRLNSDMALGVQTRYVDPDAVISRGNRHLFMAPWRGQYTLIGVNSRIYTGSAYDLTVTETEVSGFLDEINEAYQGLGLTMQDVLVVNAGLLPFGENDPDSKDLSFGKRSIVVDHEAVDGIKGLITGMSVRWTMGRQLGHRVIDLAEKKLRGSVSRSRTDRTPVWGGDIESVTSVENAIRSDRSLKLSDSQIVRLAHNYGGKWQEVSTLLAQSGSACVTDSDYTLAEVKYAVRHELASTLADLVLRRLDMGSGERPTDSTLQSCAQIMGEELGWTPARRSRELERVRASYPFAGPESQYPVSIS
jgi:glycerol-3-phosphate dehydrogenase